MVAARTGAGPVGWHRGNPLAGIGQETKTQNEFGGIKPYFCFKILLWFLDILFYCLDPDVRTS